MSNNKANSNKAFSGVSKERVEMSEKLFPIISAALNKIHQTNYSDRFWKILTGSYVKAVIYNKYLLEGENLMIEPSNTNGIEIHKTPLFTFSKIRELIKVASSIGKFNRFKSQISQGKHIGSGFHYSKALPQDIDTYVDDFHLFFKNKKVDTKLREITIDFSDNFTKTFERNIIKLIPKLYIEHFSDLMNRIPLFEADKKIFHLSQFGSDFMRFVVAKYIENGAKLYYYQHGGFYGEYNYHSAHHFESSIADQFMTWGWKLKENDVPTAAYRLEKFRDSYKENEQKSFDLLIIYPNIYNKNIKRFKEISGLFFNNINRSKYPRICARPRPMSKFRRKAALNFISKDVNKLDSGYSNMSDLISSSKLIIQMTYPSTNMFECLYLNIPTVALLENNMPSDIVKPYYDFFLEKGMFHDSIESLIDHLNTNDIGVWWKNLTKDRTYIKFKFEFLRAV